MGEVIPGGWQVRNIDGSVNQGPDLPKEPPNGGDGGGGSNVTDTLESRIQAIEEQLKHIPTSKETLLWLGGASLVVAGIIVTVLLALFNSIKLDMNNGFARLDSRFERVETKHDSIDARVRNIEIDTAALKANSATNTADLQLIRQKLEPR